MDSISFEILNTACGGVGSYEFFLNGASLGTVTADPTGNCTCSPAVQTFNGAWQEMRETWHRQKTDPGYQFDTPLPAPARSEKKREQDALVTRFETR